MSSEGQRVAFRLRAPSDVGHPVDIYGCCPQHRAYGSSPGSEGMPFVPPRQLPWSLHVIIFAKTSHSPSEGERDQKPTVPSPTYLGYRYKSSETSRITSRDSRLIGRQTSRSALVAADLNGIPGQDDCPVLRIMYRRDPVSRTRNGKSFIYGLQKRFGDRNAPLKIIFISVYWLHWPLAAGSSHFNQREH